MALVRTILGDRDPATLGRCDAHEHVIIDGEDVLRRFPELALTDVTKAADELGEFRAAGGGWIIDTMPAGCGRHAAKLAEVSRRSGVAIVCPTGLHLSRYYAPGHRMPTMDRDALAALVIEEIDHAVDDGGGPLPFRAGVIKVASQTEALIAAAHAQRTTGCPIITHTDAGDDAMHQVQTLSEHGADLSHVTLSHCDKCADVSYHRALLQAGVRLEYDQHFRQLRKGGMSASITLLAALAPEFPTQLTVGMDAARPAYWRSYGGAPGLTWLLTDLPRLLREAGLDDTLIDRLYLDNPAGAFSFAGRHAEAHA